MDIPNIDKPVTVGPGHERVDMRNNPSGDITGGLAGFDGYPQGAIAMAIRGRDLDQRRIDTLLALAKELGDLREKHRHIVSASLIDQLAGFPACKETAMAKMTLEALVGNLFRVLKVQLHEGNVMVISHVLSQGIEQQHRRSRHGVAPDKLAGANCAYRLERTFAIFH
jgi:hypothetical protein